MITAHKISKAYKTKAVVTDVSTVFPARKLSALIGPNGAGKSTLLMIVARILEATQGDIFINNRKATDLCINEYAKQISTLRQSPEINLRLTVEELVAFGRFPYSRGFLTNEDKRIVDDAIGFLSLQPLRKAYVEELSGGQRQIAFLAMIIAQQTDCLLLDEPLNNLDIKHAIQIMRALRRLCDEQGRTIILVVHDINFAANYCDHIVAMKNGSIFCSGTVQTVMTEDRLRELYGLEFKITCDENGYLCNYFTSSAKST